MLAAKIQARRITPTRNTRGGARVGAGRKKGGRNKRTPDIVPRQPVLARIVHDQLLARLIRLRGDRLVADDATLEIVQIAAAETGRAALTRVEELVEVLLVDLTPDAGAS